MILQFILGKLLAKEAHSKASLHEEVLLAQEGNIEVRNRLIEQHRELIAKIASKVCKRYINPSFDDEYSVALEAFHEAIMKYTVNKGSSFLTFADLVIRRRVIDYIRKEARHTGQLSFVQQEEGEEEQEQSALEAQVAMQRYQLELENDYRREEIMHYKERLAEFSIAFSNLPDIAPKHADARENALSVARAIVQNEHLRNALMEKKKLPITELCKIVSVSRKTVERNRIYIIAMVLLLMEEYHYLHRYVNFVGEEK